MHPIFLFGLSGWEGPYYVISIIIAGFWTYRRMINSGYTSDDFSDLLIWSLISSVIGGRLFFFLFWSPQSLISDPLEFFKVWHGGMSITGCVVMGMLGTFLCSLRKKWNFFDIANLAAPPLILGMAIGRIGCFLNGDAFGVPTNLPWGVTLHPLSIGGVTAAQWASQLGHPVKLHPTQLYEVLGDLLVLFSVNTKRSEFINKNVFAVVLGGYGIVRFLNEFLRGDANPMINLHPRMLFSSFHEGIYPLFSKVQGTGNFVWHYLSGGQVASLFMIMFAVISFFISHKNKEYQDVPR